MILMERPTDIFPVESMGHDKRSTQFSRGGCCDTLTSTDYKDPIIVAYPVRNKPDDNAPVLCVEYCGDRSDPSVSKDTSY